MRCVIGEGEEPSGDMEGLILKFLMDRESSMLMGVRRMSRECFVDMVFDVACDNGICASMYPDTSGDVVILRNWTDSDGSDVPDGKDVVYGQDMCHQYPAIGRIVRR